ncbi:VOC family protein [Shouchella clausii]|uniref:VOC family protein n=1 Tax=Shouchella TaxID=2893057 RepID=UPI0004E6CDB6|nr:MULTISPECIES: VOC family protein [Shouchella]ALA51982.1 putative DNA binding 3-demethylubiquinone-9 3-methyltransferase domain protein [Shouchella clausii]MBU3230567.1 VOC family protein [Shouchella clausii]MBU3262234.1 VOC family protein [Shouchella clausii]MBU3507451.1 VOC family protein [Shouchella clausii]MBU3535310.1 VOC family protein [Shouchella clausii]
MKRIVPHLRIENCKEEIGYYQNVFGGEIKNTQLSDGIEMFKGHEGKYIHAELHINENCILYMADVFGQKTIQGSHILLGPDLDSEEEITRIYNELSKDGEVQMELQDTFWGAKHAIVKDRNGVSWELNFSK